jgi:hypothetical protein
LLAPPKGNGGNSISAPGESPAWPIEAALKAVINRDDKAFRVRSLSYAAPLKRLLGQCGAKADHISPRLEALKLPGAAPFKREGRRLEADLASLAQGRRPP